MKKILITVICIIFIFCGCKNKNKQVTIDGVTLGSSVEEVLNSKSSTPQLNSYNLLIYQNEIEYSHKTSISYSFDNDKLTMINYTFDEEYSKYADYYNDFININKELIQEYGEPFSDSENIGSAELKEDLESMVFKDNVYAVTVWDDNIYIMHTLVADNVDYKHSLTFGYSTDSK